MEYDIGNIVHCGDSLGWIVDKKENDGIIAYKVDWADGWDHDECWYEEERIKAFVNQLHDVYKMV